MGSDARQAALERHGLTESQDGFDMTLRGLQRGLGRARALRAQGDPEALRMRALDPSDPVRVRYALCIQIEAFHAELHRSGI
ncbi:hypothetical protein [Streptomyces mirabilis]|uniref:hypothetical protein n=1 Tax=Streptomyces mirabilis TaxID=68239 RepID=UPI0033BB9406